VPIDPRTPVIVGVGQHTQRPDRGETSLEPAELMEIAAARALADAGRDLRPALQSIRMVRAIGGYPDAAALVARRLGFEGVETVGTPMGGNTPQSLLAATAAEIAEEGLDAALIIGGEAWYSLMAARREGRPTGWSEQPEGTRPDRIIGADFEMAHPGEIERGIRQPIEMYPLLENALRARAGRSVDEQRAWLGALWARASEVAAENPFAWERHPRTADEIAKARVPENRPIGLPYTKFMNSNERVDQAAALLLCSVERARALGIARDRWVFPHAVSEARALPLSERARIDRSEAAHVAAAALWRLGPGESGCRIDDVAYVDLYSCFPSAVQLQADALGMSLDRDFTVTGGMRFAGGPWNDYVTHAIATLVERLREHPQELGLCGANGGFVSKLAFGLYSSQAPARGFRRVEAREPQTGRRELDRAPKGRAHVESYTVMHDRAGAPTRGIFACRMPDGRRAWGISEEPPMLAEVVRSDAIGRVLGLQPDGRACFA